MTQAAHEQPRSDKQHNRQRALHDEQTHTRARATVGALAGTRLEIPREVEAQRLHTGGEPGEEAGEEGGRAREHHRAGVAHHAHVRGIGQEPGAQHRTAPLGHEQSRHAAARRQQHAFGD